MKILKIILIISVFLMLACNSPKPFQIKDVCAQAEGTNVIVQGYLSLPKMIDTIQLRKGERITNVGYQIFLTDDRNAVGDAVKVTFWATNKAEPNKIKAFSNGYDWNDLLVYTDDGKQIGAGKIIKVTGETVADKKNGCVVSVTKIELP